MDEETKLVFLRWGKYDISWSIMWRNTISPLNKASINLVDSIHEPGGMELMFLKLATKSMSKAWKAKPSAEYLWNAAAATARLRDFWFLKEEFMTRLKKGQLP